MSLGAEERRCAAARRRGRWLAFALSVWMLLVQFLSGTAALIHAHSGLGGHLHLVAGGLHQPDHELHERWHRSQHAGLEDSHHHGAQGQHSEDDQERVVFLFPEAPPVIDGPSDGIALPSWDALVTVALHTLSLAPSAREHECGPQVPRAEPPAGGALPLRI